MINFAEELTSKRDEILRIARSYGAVDVRLFGSAVRNELHADSDLDILVTMEAHRSLLDIVAIKQDIEDLLGRKVDVVTEAAISPYMRQQVLDEAVSL